MIHPSISANTKLSKVLEGDPQPNAIDLRVEKIRRIQQHSPFMLSENDKIHRDSVLMDVREVFHMGHEFKGWMLPPGHYELVMMNEVSVAEGEAGFVITRSTLNRNGVFITSGLYDSGYEGVMAACMHVSCGPMYLEYRARVGQYLCFNAETLSLYSGSYGHGTEDDQKYGDVNNEA